jgi:hypothetical protein
MSNPWQFMSVFEIPDALEPEKVYLKRWRLIQTPLFAIYLHKINMPDRDQDLHNHPWSFRTFIVRGGYSELFQRDATSRARKRTWKQFSWHRMGISAFHSIYNLYRVPTWTVVFTGRRQQIWGFLEEDKVTPFYQYQSERAVR